MHTATRPTGREAWQGASKRNVAIFDCPYRFTKFTLALDNKRQIWSSGDAPLFGALRIIGELTNGAALSHIESDPERRFCSPPPPPQTSPCRLAKSERVPVAPLVVSDRPVLDRLDRPLWHPALILAAGNHLEERERFPRFQHQTPEQKGEADDRDRLIAPM